MSTSIKYVAVSGMSGASILTTCGHGSSSDEGYKKESKSILEKLQDIYLKSGERQKIKTSNGAWFCLCDNRDIFYLILADKNYPERDAYSLIQDVITELKSNGNYDNADENDIHDHLKQCLPEILERYCEGETSDNIGAVQQKANQIKEVMADTIHKAIENRETMDELSHKSENLNNLARGFHDSSKSLHDKMRRGHQRKMMIYGGIAVAVILVLYLIIH